MSVSKLVKTPNAPRFIAVEGPIGVGKTSLARKLADSLSAETVLEEVFENPFLERFYQDGQSAALPAQMFFLFARARQVEGLRQSDLPQVGTQSVVSEILSGKRRLNTHQVAALARRFGVPAGVFIDD